MIVEKKVAQIERIERNGLDKEILNKRGNSKTFGGWLIQRIKEARDNQKFETAIFLNELYKKYMEFESSEKFRAKMWKGKSGVSFILYPDKVISIRYKKEEPDSEPKEVHRELMREEINLVIYAINSIDKKEWIKTSDIGEKVYRMRWKDIFSDRFKHTQLVEILNFLEYKEWIEYSRAGKVKVITKLEEQKTLI